MKRGAMCLIVVLLCALSPAPLVAESQTRDEARNAVLFGLLEPVAGAVDLAVGSPWIGVPLDVTYQRVLADHFVLSSMIELSYDWVRDDAPQDSEAVLNRGVNGWTLGVLPLVDLRWHPFHGGLRGLHLGVAASLTYLAIYADTPTVKGFQYDYFTDLGLTVGWRFLLPASIVIDVALGVIGIGYSVSVDTNKVVMSRFGLCGPLDIPPGDICIGFRF